MPSLVWSRSLQKEPQFLEVPGQDRATPRVRAHAADQCWEDPPAGSPGVEGRGDRQGGGLLPPKEGSDVCSEELPRREWPPRTVYAELPRGSCETQVALH